jgi:hypothetical protein
MPDRPKNWDKWSKERRQRYKRGQNDDAPPRDQPGGNKPPEKNPYGFLPPELQQYLLGQGNRSYQNQATSMVDWMLAPQLDAIGRGVTEAKDEYGEMAERGSNIYGGFVNEMGDLGQAATPQFDALQSDYMDQLGAFSSMMPTGYAPETAAAAGVFGAEGTGMLGLLSNAESRNAMYNQSAGRQGAIEQRDYQGNLNNNLGDLLNDYRQQRIDLEAQKPNLLAQQLMQLKQMGFENILAARQMAENMKAGRQGAKSNNALMEYLLGQIPGDRRGPRDDDGRGPGGTGRNPGSEGTGTNGDPGPGNSNANVQSAIGAIWDAIENVSGVGRRDARQALNQYGPDVVGVLKGISNFLPDNVSPDLDVNANQTIKWLKQLLKGTPVGLDQIGGITDELEEFLGLRPGSLQNRLGNSRGVGVNPGTTTVTGA